MIRCIFKYNIYIIYNEEYLYISYNIFNILYL